MTENKQHRNLEKIMYWTGGLEQSSIAVFITASSRVEKTKRAYETAKLSFENVHVNINSLRPDIVEQNEQYCKDNGIVYTITESNGYPAKGKNATYDWFKEFDYEWLVAVDGDDYLDINAFAVFEALIRSQMPDIGCLVFGKAVRWENDLPVDPDLYFRKTFYNSYLSNVIMMDKMTSASTGSIRASRCVLYRRSVIVNNIARMDESIRGFEDFQALLRYSHYKKTKDLHLVKFNCQFDSYIYDVSEVGDHTTAIYQKPEVFSENMVNFWKGIEGYDYYLDAADYMQVHTVYLDDRHIHALNERQDQVLSEEE